MSPSIVIIDYGSGNAVNVQNALRKLGADPLISASEREWKEADGLIFPGVGAFGAAMQSLGSRADALKQAITDSGIPFLGICLGMQLLFKESEESAGTRGLGVLEGIVSRFENKTGLPIPQMGWNEVEVRGNSVGISDRSPLFNGLPDRFYAYFVHSYYCRVDERDRTSVCARTSYGIDFDSALCRGNIFATQFHPEKSGKDGLLVLQNFLNEVKR